MRNYFVIAALLCAPTVGQAQTFVAQQTGDLYAPGFGAGGGGVADHTVHPWGDFRYTAETAFGFQYDGPPALLSNIGLRIHHLEGSWLGVALLRGPTRQTAELLTTWSIDARTFERSPNEISANRIAYTPGVADVSLMPGEVYWISLFADGPELPGYGKGLFNWIGGDGTRTDYAARSEDRGATWVQFTDRAAPGYVVTARMVPEPASLALLLAGATGLFLRRRAMRRA